MSEHVREIIGSEAHEIVVSAVSAWEIATKARLGKLDLAKSLERAFVPNVTASGYQLLPISVEHALRAGRLTGVHKDPFDRMLAAQALHEDIPILSLDTKLDVFGVRREW